jgi:hypothetical protein
MMRTAYAMPMGLFADKRERPRLELEPSSLERTMTVMAWLAVATAVGVVLRYWPALPAEVPQHFDARGEVEASGPRWWLLGLPLLALVLVGGTSWVMRYPHLYNFLWPITAENAKRQYELANEMLATVQAVTGWMFAALAWEVCRIALGESDPVAAYSVPLLVGLLFATLGAYFVRAYRAR